MSVRDKVRWREWADGLRLKMMAQLIAHVAKSVQETAAERPASVGTQRFWRTRQAGTRANDTLSKAGIDIEGNAEGKDATVTLQLNDSWKAIMKQVLDRRADRRPF